MRRLESKTEPSPFHNTGNEVVAAILEVIQMNDGGVSMIRIMNRTRLPFQQLDEYLVLLVMNDLVVYNKATKTYAITRKGVDFLKAYTQVSSLYEVIDEEIGL